MGSADAELESCRAACHAAAVNNAELSMRLEAAMLEIARLRGLLGL
jgi:hypothetical protein